MKNPIRKLTLSFLLCVGLLRLPAQLGTTTDEMTLRADQAGSPIQSTMYGIFFEDINFGADGGLYAELVKNRSFEFEYPFGGWTPFGSVSIETKNPAFDRNPHYARLSYNKEFTQTGLENEGFKGMGVKAGEKYDLTLYARTDGSVTLRIELITPDNDIFETKKMDISGKGWAKHSVVLTPETTVAKARLRITMETKGTIDMDHVSLFPQKTFNNRKNGLRTDLAQALKDLHPGVFRFPGGCIVEGTSLETRYQWKNSVGPVENRPININRWNYTFSHRKFPDYYQSYGLGFYEYFLLSEDIGAEPLPVISCGLACQFENDDESAHCPVDKLQPFIDDALDLIEFANGPTTSKWGKVRAEMGHPESFNLKFIAVGNEQWGKLYPERLEPFVKQIRAKYPDIKIIGSSGPNAEGREFEYLWPEMKRLEVDLVDEHYYRSPEWFLNGAKRYDSYDRSGPKVFAGEYAAHAKDRANDLLTALSEAAFMTGLERNADVVHLCTYAPLFAHVDAWQWRPDLIWFDNLSVVKTPNYYVQQLYGQNPGTHVVPLTLGSEAVTGQNDLYATAALDRKTNELIVKIVNAGMQHRNININLTGLSAGKHKGKQTLLHAMNLSAHNTVESPAQIAPVEKAVEIEAPAWKVAIPPFAFAVYRIVL